jgi:hypothetical protein
MSQPTIEQKKLTITVQVLLAIIISTVTICFTVISSVYQIKEEIAGALRNLETENKIQDLKLENLKIEVDRNRLAIEKAIKEIEKRGLNE